MIVAHVSLTPLAGAVWAAAEAFREAGYDLSLIHISEPTRPY